MGHYWSEMGPDTPVEREPEKRIPITDKPTRVDGSTEQGSFTEEATIIEIAAEYDDYDPRAPGKYNSESGSPDNWDYVQHLRVFQTPYGEENAIKLAERIIKTYGAQFHTKRPGRVLRRSVTYGPWEEVKEVTDSTEGWY